MKAGPDGQSMNTRSGIADMESTGGAPEGSADAGLTGLFFVRSVV